MSPVYLKSLDELVALCKSIKNTPMTAQARISALALMNLAYEKLQIDRDLPEHPFVLVDRLIRQAIYSIKSWAEMVDMESENISFDLHRDHQMETMHQDLFQRLWTQYDIDQYKKDRIARYEYRIKINALESLIAGKSCIDFGCGHGNFAHALLNCGAKKVLGIDYGKGSLEYAERMRGILGVPSDKLAFKHCTVYECGEQDDSYDFAIQNGVFHHLDNEDLAYREVFRVLKKGGWFWVYTDGENAISHHLWDASRVSLENVPPQFIIDQLANLNLSTGKRYHLGDGFNAVYRHTSWSELTGRLENIGFGNFRRITGGFQTDFDHDVIAMDKYGSEKFGSGDLRLLCQKL